MNYNRLRKWRMAMQFVLRSHSSLLQRHNLFQWRSLFDLPVLVSICASDELMVDLQQQKSIILWMKALLSLLEIGVEKLS